MRAALRSLIALSLLGGAALYLCPEGGGKRIMKLLVTAVLVAAVLEPLRTLDYDRLSVEEARLSSSEIEILYDSEQKVNRLKGQLLRQNCERYVTTQAQALGLNVKDIEITLSGDREESLRPESVTIKASGGAEEMERLCRLMRDELGIPVERQVWITDES